MRDLRLVLACLAAATSAAVDCDSCWQSGFAPQEDCCSQCPSQCPSGKCAMIHSTGWECYNPHEQIVCNLGTAFIVCNKSAVCPSYGPCSGGAFPAFGCGSCPQGQHVDESHCDCLTQASTKTLTDLGDGSRDCLEMGQVCKPSSNTCCNDETGAKMQCVSMGTGPPMCISGIHGSRDCLEMGQVCNTSSNTCCNDETGAKMQCVSMGTGPPVCISGLQPGLQAEDCKWMSMPCSATLNGTCGWDDADSGVRIACRYANAVCATDSQGQRRCMTGPPRKPTLII